MGKQSIADKIGIASIKSRDKGYYENPEYIVSDNVDQMILLYEILKELRKLNQR